MNYLRFDSVGGASGDMILSALVAMGADLEVIAKTINSFLPEKLHFHAQPAAESGLNGTRVTVHADHDPHPRLDYWPDAAPHDHAHDHSHSHAHGHAHGHAHTHSHEHRGLNEIHALLTTAPISERSRALALAVFQELAVAEAHIHGKTPESVHFHEVGAWDSIADIVGACLALEQLDIAGVSCGPLPAGCGTLKCAHGEMPNPAPATQELLSGMKVVQTDEPFELVTPTGAALLRVWSRTLATVPTATAVVKSAFGFGTLKLNARPNVLRATMLRAVATSEPTTPAADLLVLETNLDDTNPEWLGGLITELLQRGARDVWHTPIVMKKGRLGTMLSVLAPHDTADVLRDWIFRATTTFGIRSYAVERTVLERHHEEVVTPWGSVSVKVGLLDGTPITAKPEFEVCRKLAQEHDLTTRRVCQSAHTLIAQQLKL